MMGWKLMVRVCAAPVMPEVKEDKDEELEPVSDEDGEAIVDADSDVDA
jgi:hypothetical protein